VNKRKEENKNNIEAVDNTNKEPTIAELLQMKNTAEDFEKRVQFWTVDNPLRMIERRPEYVDEICANAESAIQKLSSKYRDDEDVDTLTGYVTAIIIHYRACVEGIDMWWKYTHLED